MYFKKSIFLTNNSQRPNVILDNKLVSALDEGKEIFNKSFNLLKDYVKVMKQHGEKDIKNENIFQIHIVGPDIIFDENMNPYLLEFNIYNPAYILRNNNIEIKLLKYKIANDIMNNFIHSYLNTHKINLSQSKFVKLS